MAMGIVDTRKKNYLEVSKAHNVRTEWTPTKMKNADKIVEPHSSTKAKCEGPRQPEKDENHQ